MESRYRSWLHTLVETRRSANGFGAWVATSALVLGILLLAAFVEPINHWFKLDFTTGVGCFAPAMAFGLVAGWTESRGSLPLSPFGAMLLVGSALLQFFFAALVLNCSAPGSFVMAAFFLLTVTFHGYLHRATPRYWFTLLPTILGTGFALALWPTSSEKPLLYFISITGILLSLITGAAGLNMHENVVQSDKLRQALHYRQLEEQRREHDKMARAVLDLLRNNHDAGNTLSTMFLHAQLLEDRVAAEGQSAEAEALKAPIKALLVQLDRLKTLIASGHRVADDLPVVEDVPVLGVVEEVSKECGSLFPGVAIKVQSSIGEQPTVKVHEGTIGLRRLAENLLRNACEGSGGRGARKVVVDIGRLEGHVRLRFSDDGPGFAHEQLVGAPKPLKSTKPNGHGLGLYSVSALVGASGGALERHNNASGGAVVDVLLHPGTSH